MNIFDVLREKLEESKSDWNNDYNVPINEAIKIVNQVEQEFGNPTICYLGGPCEYQTEDVNHNNGWIPCSERLPDEYDSIFTKFVGTDKWKTSMFKKTSDTVNVTVADDKGQTVTTHAHLVDGEWCCDLLRCHKEYRITAWQPLPQPYEAEGVQR